MADYADFVREKRGGKCLRAEVDALCRDIVTGEIGDRAELEARTEKARKLCRELFPERDMLFEMIYRSRFQRLWDQFGRRCRQSPG